MKNWCLILVGLSLVAGTWFPAGTARAQMRDDAPFIVAQGANCYAIGQRVAAQMGGQLAAATAENQGGQTVCRIVVLVPGGNGERPRRTEVVVPAR